MACWSRCTLGLHDSQLRQLRCLSRSGNDVRLLPVPQEEDPETYQTHFASYIANDLDGDSLEDKYKEVNLRPVAVPLP